MRAPTEANLIEAANRLFHALSIAEPILARQGQAGDDEAWAAYSQAVAALTWFMGEDVLDRDLTGSVN